jgi:predicted dehydrogenase
MPSEPSERTNEELSGAMQANRRLRVGIVGCGEVAQIIHAPALYQLPDRYEITALCDVSPTILEQLGKLWNVGILETDYRAIVARAEVDVLLIANPNAYHSEVTLAALAAGKHVLVEKPMCISSREADEIVAAQKKSGTVVQVGYMRRYAPAFLDGCALVREIGEIKYGRVRDIIGANSLVIDSTSRVIRDAAFLESIKKEAENRDDALVEEALGGNANPSLKRAYRLMLGLSSHDISAMRELLGMPKRVLFAAERFDGGYLSAVFDYGSYVCQFETGVDAIPRFDGHLEVYGAQKVVRIQYDTPYVRNLPIRLFVTESNGRGGVERIDSHPSWGDPFIAEWNALYDNIVEKRAPKTGPEDFAQDLVLFGEMARLMREPTR